MHSPIDLHTHSTASDGVLPPADVVALAAARGVRTLALTDHDTTDGLAAAQQRASLEGVMLVPGVEISVTWGGRTFHLIGLRIDPQHALLQCGLAKLRAIREQRGREIGRLLERVGLEGAYQAVCEMVQGEVVGRAHYAQLLVERGLAADSGDAFRRYLSCGRTGYVDVQWVSLDEAMGWVHGAGGIAVLAHPFQHRYPRAFLRRMLAAFAAEGGDALEIVTGGCNAGHISAATACARRLSLAGSLGSDFHTPVQSRNSIGRIRALPREVVPIWERWPLVPQS